MLSLRDTLNKRITNSMRLLQIDNKIQNNRKIRGMLAMSKCRWCFKKVQKQKTNEKYNK